MKYQTCSDWARTYLFGHEAAYDSLRPLKDVQINYALTLCDLFTLKNNQNNQTDIFMGYFWLYEVLNKCQCIKVASDQYDKYEVITYAAEIINGTHIVRRAPEFISNNSQNVHDVIRVHIKLGTNF